MKLSVYPVVVVLMAITSTAQQVVRQGPPPEIRALIDAFPKAANGDAAAWEAFASEHFTAALLKRQTADERASLHARIADRFGAIALNGVRREGPSAPLQVNVKGSKAAGVVVIELDPGSPKISAIRIEDGPPAARAEASGVPAPPVDGSLPSDEISRRLGGYFAKLAQDEVFSGVALVAKNGVPVFLQAYGMADRDKKIPNTIQTRFNIGSINKAFTQIAINQLIAEGMLSAKDTLGKFFPDYPQAPTRAATVEQLLTHRAGVADFFGPDFDRATKSSFASNADYFRFVGTLPLTFSPGERSQYCNGCYIALGAIVEKVSGMPYEKYVAEKVFGRAEMTSTGYLRSDQPASDIALGYTRRAGDGLRSSIEMHGVTGSAAGGGYSTALDLLTFVKALNAGKFPGTDGGIGIAGGAPGTNAIVESAGEWTVIVLSNFDPPVAENIGQRLASVLLK